jgi:hypothetical protein
MSEIVQSTAGGTDDDPLPSSQTASEIQVKSYTYLRVAIVGLLVALGAAVFYQSAKQGSFLASVSAYYYTPAQAIFVGALIGMGTAMIALRGRSAAEEIFLNLGGVFAAVVAIVPTSRGTDYRTAVDACRDQATTLVTGLASGGADCPTVLALEEATRANVQNNVLALLVVGLLSLAATCFFGRRDRVLNDRWFRIGFVTAALVWTLGAFSFVVGLGLLIAWGHYVAAVLLLLCILAVAVANATRRRTAEESGDGAGLDGAPDTSTVGSAMFRQPQRLDRYAWLAWVMLVGTVLGIVLWVVGLLSLFWLEIAAALLFAVFWAVQTIEQLPPRRAPHPARV